MGLVRGAFSGFGFRTIRVARRCEPARRQPNCRRFRGLASHCPTGRGAQSANGGFRDP